MARREYQAGRPTTLSVALNIGGTSFTIANDTNWPDGADYDFWVTVDGGTAQEERILCSARSGSTVTVATSGRGKDGTTEANHAVGASVWPSWSATDADEANEHINATTNIHGITGALAPIASPTFTGTVVLPSATSIGSVSSTEIGYVDGVTSAIQTQLNTLTTNLAAAVPAGVITQFGGSSAPTGWVLCDGTAYSRTVTYNNLFTAIGTTYGTGDGSTTFNVPNLKGRVPVGQDTTANTTYTISNKALTSNVATLTTSAAHDLIIGNSVTVSGVDATFNGTYTVTGTTSTTFTYAKTATNVTSTSSSGSVIAAGEFDTLGETGGAKKHTLVTGEIPAHTHPGQVVFGIDQATGSGGIDDTTIGNTQPNTGSAGGSGAHNNLQPYIVVNYIIKT